ncbi:MAG: SUMF1/EgtB/PvdO family nonheme iron enzyme [Nitrospira sp.]|nr:SUMF1/EgtB/PvdO family nonheme iron enzyme [Nitrospira sp.]
MRLFRTTVVMSALLLFLPWSVAAEEPQSVAVGQQSVTDVIHGKDGAPMVLIPAGAFTMGSNEEVYLLNDRNMSSPLMPIAIDRYEVSMRLYRKFLQEAQRDAPPTWDDEAAETVGESSSGRSQLG